MTKNSFCRHKGFLLCLAAISLQPLKMFADPADPSFRRVVTLPDGQKAVAALIGDEHEAYWQLTDGSSRRFSLIEKDGRLTPFKPASASRFEEETPDVASSGPLYGPLRQARSTAERKVSKAFGTRRVPVIMVQFSDVRFQAGNDVAFFNRFFNERGFSEGLFKGSVADYFIAQSNGMFQPQFDVYGPVTLPGKQAYYGEDEDSNKQKNMSQLLSETLEKADGSLDFSLYDWDGDGQVEQFIILYAGLGQSSGGGTETIWPHRSWMTAEVRDAVVVRDYCCFSELRVISKANHVNGIGTACHEFSHCLGLPDMYDGDDVNYGTQYWDMMAVGTHNDNGFTPAGYTSYDKMLMGWQQPVILERSGHVSDMKPMSENGNFYMIRNDNHPDEYYLLENRQKTGWDAAIPGGGLLVLHVDYDPRFASNPNKTKNTENTHPRCAIVNADNDETIDKQSNSARLDDLCGDLFGYKNHAFTDNTTPAAELYNMNIDSRKFMGKPVTNIYQDGNGNMSFDFENAVAGRDIYMLGTDDMRMQFASDTSFDLKATIKNFSKKAYKRWVGAYVYGEGAWQSHAFVMMDLEPQASQEVTFTLKELKSDVDYQVAIYYYENDTTNSWKRMTDFKKFKMGQDDGIQLAVVGSPTISITSEKEATVDLVVRNESMTPFNKRVAAWLQTESGWHSESPSATYTISAHGEQAYHFKYAKLDPQIPYLLYVYYYDKTDDGQNPWKFLYGPSLLYSGGFRHKKGDVNGDGAVDVADIATIITVMASVTEFDKQDSLQQAADVNGDGTVDVADVATVISIMATK